MERELEFRKKLTTIANQINAAESIPHILMTVTPASFCPAHCAAPHSALVEDHPSSLIYTGLAPPGTTIAAWIAVNPRKKYWLTVWVPGRARRRYGEAMLHAVRLDGDPVKGPPRPGGIQLAQIVDVIARQPADEHGRAWVPALTAG